MPRTATFSVQPIGRHDSQEERLRLSPLDLVITQQYNNYALIFEVAKDSDKPAITETVRRALEATLGQCHHVAGTIEKNEYGDFSIVTKPDSTVPLVVQRFDAPRDQYPSFSQLERVHFCSGYLGDPALLTNQGMNMSSEASPNTSPAVAGFQITFIPDGMILTANIHHFAMDVTGASGLVHQLAAHCHSLGHGSSPPTWDESLIDRCRLIPLAVPEEAMVDPQPSAPRHPDWLPCAWLLFHIPLSKVAELKSLAMPTDESWISTYDAISAFLWRILSKNRAHIYEPDLRSPAIFGESVDMRSRCKCLALSKAIVLDNQYAVCLC